MHRPRSHDQQKDAKVKFAAFPSMLYEKLAFGISLRMCLLPHDVCLV